MLAQGLAWIICCLALSACDNNADEALVVKAPWVRAMMPGQSSTAAYMEFLSREPAVLIAVASPRVQRIELHRSEMREGVMRMQEVSKLDLAAGKSVRLQPGGYHLMLSGVEGSLSPGMQLTLTLTIERADKSRFTVDVEAAVLERRE